jgi:hypothetical protein
VHKSARRCTPSALCLGLGLRDLTYFVRISLLAFLFVLELLVLETLVRPRGKSVGVASVASAGRRLPKGLSGLCFYDRVENKFDPFVF